MNEVEEYIYGYEGDTLEVMKYLHNLMMDQPGIYCKLSFNIPFYYIHNLFRSVRYPFPVSSHVNQSKQQTG